MFQGHQKCWTHQPETTVITVTCCIVTCFLSVWLSLTSSKNITVLMYHLTSLTPKPQSHLLNPGLSCCPTPLVNTLVFFFLSFSCAVSPTWPRSVPLSLACCSLKERSSWGQKGPGTWGWMTWKTMMTISSPPRNHWSTREGWAQRKGDWVGKQGREPSW